MLNRCKKSGKGERPRKMLNKRDRRLKWGTNLESLAPWRATYWLQLITLLGTLFAQLHVACRSAVQLAEGHMV